MKQKSSIVGIVCLIIVFGIIVLAMIMSERSVPGKAAEPSTGASESVPPEAETTSPETETTSPETETTSPETETTSPETGTTLPEAEKPVTPNA